MSRRSRPETPSTFLEEIPGNGWASGRARTSCFCCPPTVPAEKTPHWIVRPFILKGYRVDYSPWQMFISLFYIHNETGNIWSHIWGFAVMCRLIWIVFLCGQWQSLEEVKGVQLSPTLEKFAVGSFLIFAAIAFFLSSMYHIASCTSEKTCSLLLRLDVTGIALLISASFLPGVFYGFACFPKVQHVYLFCVCIMLVAGLVASNFGSPHDERVARVRTAIFACSVAFGFVVAIHWVFLVNAEARNLLFGKLFGMLGCYAVGFLVYSTSFPERLKPGVFDYAMHSHQIWHLLVFAAVYIWYLSSVESHNLLATRGCVAFVPTLAENFGGEWNVNEEITDVGIRGKLRGQY